MLREFLFRARSLFRRRALDAEMESEIEFHIEREAEKLAASGVEPGEARRRARLAFGAAEAVKEACREVRGAGRLEILARDILFGFRLLRRNPVFAAVAVTSLALGIGANTAMFQLLDAVQLRSLPVRDPARLYTIRVVPTVTGHYTSRYSNISFAQWEQIRAQQRVFSELAVWSPRRFNLAPSGEMRLAEGMLVSGAFFATLGVEPARGRLLDAQHDAPGCGAAAAVLSDAFWKREFQARADVVGRTLSLDGHAFTIAGVTPPGFFGVEVGRSFDVAIPLCAEDVLAGAESQLRAARHNYWLAAIGRLAPGQTEQTAAANLDAISGEVLRSTLPPGADVRQVEKSRLKPRPVAKGFSWFRVRYETALRLLFGSAALVLLIACANLANLLLAKGSARAHEISVRSAVGASNGRIFQQLLTEAMLIAGMGAGAGLALSFSVNRWLLSFLVTADEPVALDTGLNHRVLLFSVTAAFATCILFGLIPAIRAVRLRGTAIPGWTRSVAGTRAGTTLRRVLVGAQVALSLVLLTGALLFGRSLWGLMTSDPGFRAEKVLVASVDARRLGFDDLRRGRLFSDLLERLRAAPGLANAAFVTVVPLSGWEYNTSLLVNNKDWATARWNPVSSDYFDTLGTRFLAGRDFGPEDEAGAPETAIVNEVFARRFFPDGGAVGQSLSSPFDEKARCRIVGVVENTKFLKLDEEFGPIVYFPAALKTGAGSSARYVVRSALPPAEAARAVREAVAGVNPALDLEFIRLDTQVRESIARERLIAALSGGFAALAALLAAVGLYGVLAYSVATRANEFGIRMALGADPARIVGTVLAEALPMLGIGICAGLAVALAAGRAARSLLFGTAPHDPVALGGAAVLLLLIGVVSALAPARQAAKVDPAAVLQRQ